MDSTPAVYYLAGTVALAIAISRLIKAVDTQRKFAHIPTVGPSGIFTSYIGAFKWIVNANAIIQEGYDKFYGRAFRVPQFNHWLVIVSGPKLIDDLRKAPDDYLDFEQGAADILQLDHTMAPSLYQDPYHHNIVRTPLTRNIGARFPEVQDELAAAFKDEIPPQNDWVKVPAMKTALQIVCRTSNRYFVGLPLCRDPDYLDLNIRHTIDVFIGSKIIRLFPEILKPIATRLFTKKSSNMRRALKHLAPVIQERLDKEGEYGPDWPGKPNDVLTWLLAEAHGARRTVADLTMRVLALNIVAIHTTSMAFTYALFRLAANPELVGPLREEVESVIAAHGWSKASMPKLRKLDSFLKESQRLSGLGSTIMLRKVKKDFTFSDGTTVPAGHWVAAAGYATHHDDDNYLDAEEFQSTRYADIRESADESIKHQMITPTTGYLAFGSGRHACPGRFFAVTELKAIFTHILLNYDVKFENEGVLPETTWFSDQQTPDRNAEVMFRARVSS